MFAAAGAMPVFRRSRGISPEIRMTSGFCAYEFFASGLGAVQQSALDEV